MKPVITGCQWNQEDAFHALVVDAREHLGENVRVSLVVRRDAEPRDPVLLLIPRTEFQDMLEALNG